MRRKAFTLAEILMVLAIIGMISAMTIPSLKSTVDNQVNSSGVLETYAILSNAFKMYTGENGCSGDIRGCMEMGNKGELGGVAHDGEIRFFTYVLKPYLKISKDCELYKGKGCWADVPYKFLSPNVPSDLNLDNWAPQNTRPDDELHARYRAQLANNMSVMILDFNGCDNDYSSNHTSPLNKTCGFIHVDVNGKKPPNQWGRDTFNFYYTVSGVYPSGMKGDKIFSDTNGNAICNPFATSTTYWNSTSSNINDGSGWGCTAKVIQDRGIRY